MIIYFTLFVAPIVVLLTAVVIGVLFIRYIDAIKGGKH